MINTEVPHLDFNGGGELTRSVLNINYIGVLEDGVPPIKKLLMKPCIDPYGVRIIKDSWNRTDKRDSRNIRHTGDGIDKGVALP